MNKILISIYVLSMGMEFDLFIPINKNMKEALLLIQKSIEEFTNGEYKARENVLLYTELEGKLININNTVKYSGLKYGSRVLLV